MTEALSVIPDVEVSYHSLHRCINPCRMIRVRTSLFAISENVLTLQPENAPGSRSEYMHFVSDFEAFLTLLVPKLEKRASRLSSLTACIVGTADEHVFWELWGCLEAGCVAFCSVDETSSQVWDEQGESGGQPFCSSLFVAVNSMLTWFLSFSRSPAWQLMRSEHCRDLRNEELLKMLLLPVRCLLEIIAGSYLTGITVFALLPPNIVPLICCIFVEQFANVPPIVPTAQLSAGMKATTYTRGVVIPAADLVLVKVRMHHFVEHLTALIYHLAVIYCSPGVVELLPLLMSPAVVQLIKVSLLISTRTQPSTPALSEYNIPCFGSVLVLLRFMFRVGDFLSPKENTGNRDSSGLPVHLSAAASSQVLETDMTLLHALSVHMGAHVSLTVPCCLLQAAIVQSWQDAGRLYSIPPVRLSMMQQSLVGLAHQCTTHALHLMHLMVVEKGVGQPQKRSNNPRQKQQRKQARKKASTMMEIKLELWNVEGMRGLRSMMRLVSHFQTYTTGTKIVPNDGEHGEG